MVGRTERWALAKRYGEFPSNRCPERDGTITAQSRRYSALTIPINGLHRPVHSSYADLDGDGLQDIIVCEFGKWAGALSWYKNKGNYNYEKQVLWNKPSTIKADVHDMNQDQQPDTVALFEQADEGIDIYHNEAEGKFSRERVIGFSATQGSIFPEMKDFNTDGHLDIL